MSQESVEQLIIHQKSSISVDSDDNLFKNIDNINATHDKLDIAEHALTNNKNNNNDDDLPPIPQESTGAHVVQNPDGTSYIVTTQAQPHNDGMNKPTYSTRPQGQIPAISVEEGQYLQYPHAYYTTVPAYTTAAVMTQGQKGKASPNHSTQNNDGKPALQAAQGGPQYVQVITPELVAYDQSPPVSFMQILSPNMVMSVAPATPETAHQANASSNQMSSSPLVPQRLSRSPYVEYSQQLASGSPQHLLVTNGAGHSQMIATTGLGINGATVLVPASPHHMHSMNDPNGAMMIASTSPYTHYYVDNGYGHAVLVQGQPMQTEIVEGQGSQADKPQKKRGRPLTKRAADVVENAFLLQNDLNGEHDEYDETKSRKNARKRKSDEEDGDYIPGIEGQPPAERQRQEKLFDLKPGESVKCPFLECEYTFTDGKTYRLHLTTHQSDRQFICDLCQSRFTRLPDLQRHHRSMHSEDKPFVCPHDCGKSFSRKDALKRHLEPKSTGIVCAGFRRKIIPYSSE